MKTQNDYKNQLSYFLIDEIASRMLDRLSFVTVEFQNILLAGFWSEPLLENLTKQYPEAKFTYLLPPSDLSNLAGIVKDKHHQITLVDEKDSDTLESLTCKYDLVLSNLYLHHFEIPNQEVERLKSLLNEKGCLYFSTIGPVTLFQPQLNEQPPANWIDMHHLGDLLKKFMFLNPVIDAEHLTLTYQKFIPFYQDIKSICPLLAINNIDEKNALSLFSMLSLQEGKATMPVEVIYGHAWQNTLPKQHTLGNDTYISIDQLGLKR